MSRLWSRFGLRTLSIGLLLAVVVGGLYVIQDRQAGSGGNPAAAATKASANEQQLAERMAARAASTSRQRAAQQQAEQKAKAAAKAAAKRARRVNDAAVRVQEEKQQAASGGGSGNKATVPYAGPVPSSCNEYKGNRRTGCALLLDAGFGLNQMSCLDKLWARESGWNHRARNNSSGAYGIPQALPGNKMSSAGSDWESNPATQIKWGLGYIKGRYGTPCSAWSHSQNVGWY